jgi:tRNA nucleotidyltransferase (CCA-adding enzyme)
MEKEYSFGVIPVFKQENGKYLFLLVQAMNSDDWFFPKGHREGNESELMTASRELMEEAGIKNIDIKSDVFFVENYDRYILKENSESEILNKTVKMFLGFVSNKDVKIQHSEIKDYKWAIFEEAQNLIKYEQGKRVLQEANEYLISH